MATYEITLEFETVLSVDGTRVKAYKFNRPYGHK